MAPGRNRIWLVETPQPRAAGARRRAGDGSSNAWSGAPSRVSRAKCCSSCVSFKARSSGWLFGDRLGLAASRRGAAICLEVQLLTVIVSWCARRHAGGSTRSMRSRGSRRCAGDGANDAVATAPLAIAAPRRARRRRVRADPRTELALGRAGTVYNWTLTFCWFAAVPVFLVLVRWWRQTVFERMDRVRRKSPLQSWLLANRTGWKSFFAAMIAAVHLFGLGAYKTAMKWLAGFYLTRKAHAYLFKRSSIGSPKASRPRDAATQPRGAGVTCARSPGRGMGRVSGR